MSSYHLDHLQFLETEAIHVLREAAAESERPVLLFSGGKSSACLSRLAEKAFRPSEIPMPLLNIEAGDELPALTSFRNRQAKELGAKLIVRTVDEALAKGMAHTNYGQVGRYRLQIPVLLEAIEEFQFDCCIGGARRDEEKGRAKERFFSFRDASGQWEPKNQRPEIWNLFNAKLNPGENARVFPLSNWTDTDVWAYLKREKLVVPDIYFGSQ
jgi:sulfate adenylyltransferase subunit 2